LEELSQQVPVWWWPAAILGGSIPVIVAAGIVYYNEAPAVRVVLEPPAAKTVRYRTASMFKRLLEEKGFHTGIHVFAASVVVDFDHHEVRRLVLGLPYRLDLLRRLVIYSTAGSAEFTDHGLVDANVPVVLARDPAATGLLTRQVKLYEGMRLEEAHWHIQDGLTVFDLHVSYGLPEMPSADEMALLAEALADVVDQTTKVSISVLKGVKGEGSS
jgi:hypothetical protein